MRFLKLVILLLTIVQMNYGQTDNTFWFAAPDISSTHGDNPWNGAPLNMHITAVHATHVKISRPADPGFTPIEFNLAEMEHRSIRLDTWPGLPIDHIETYPMPNLVTGIQNKGFLIETDPGEVTAYYELDQYWDRDIFSLKGKNALGREFRISLQKTYPNGAYGGTAWSGFVIVATEDNTTVTVQQNAAWLYFPVFPAARTIVLNKGETFAFQASSTVAAQHISGVYVTSTKDIAITIFDDSVRKKNSTSGTCNQNISYDVVGDQTVPIRLIGLEYVIMKGEVTNVPACDGGERIFITSTQPNTQIFVDGAALPITTIVAAGGIYSYPITNNSTHIRGSKPIYIFHTTGFGGELGGAVLPTIDGCTGSNNVTFTRTPNTLDQFLVNIMVRNDTATGSLYRNQAVNNFTVTVNGITDTIPAAYFEYIMDSAFAVLRNLPGVDAFFASHITPGDEARISNPVARFHLGVINGGASTGCKYGYFSDYAASSGLAGLGGAVLRHQQVYCNLDPIQLVASGGRGYEWECSSNPGFTQYITDTTIADPYFFPPDSGFYRFNVKIIGECSFDTTIVLDVHVFIGPTSDFTLSESEGCSPFTSVLTNISNTAYAREMIWVFGNPYQEINQDTIPSTFSYTFPPNTSDTIQTYSVQLMSWESDFHECPNTKERFVRVKPEVNTDFSGDPMIGCHPLLTTFSDSSWGHLDSTSYFWDFDDRTQSFEQNPTHSFENFSLIDDTFNVKLTTESPFGCLDSMIKPLIVHPRIRTSMAINTAASCSPLNITVDPMNSIGVDTFFWYVHSPDALGTGFIDTSYITQINLPVSIYHYDSSYASPDTILINLIGMNRMGCTDTFPERNIVVFPEVISRFGIPNDSICDADSIHFTNESIGFNLFYEWDFDNGTFLQDTTDADFTQAFYNRSDQDSAYRVSLWATSGYFCESTFDTVIIVHPYIKANFGMDYENNCTPILTTFTNLSIRAHACDWNFGDDSTSTTMDTVFTHQFWNNSATNDTTYWVSLIARNNEGCSDTISRTLDIFPHVVANFDQTDSIGCSPLTVSFSNSSSGGVLSFLWDFGNGTSSTNPNPTSRTYTNYSAFDTTYYTSLTAINPYGCDSAINDSVTVFAFVEADFNLQRADSCSPFTIHPVNLSSVGAHVYEWDFLGSGLPTSNTFEPVLPPFTNTSLVTDTVEVRLISYSFNDAPHRACADTQTMRVLIYPELQADFDLSTLVSCQPLVSNIMNNTNLPSGDYNRQWYVDNTFYSAASNPVQLNIPNLESVDVPHTIWLYGESLHGCRDTASQNIMVYSLVDSRFTINQSGICSADTFELDRRTSRGGITNYVWNFQGTLYTIPDSVFNYSFTNLTNDPVSQRIILIVNNTHACVDSSSRTINVYPEVRADFNLDVNQVCYPHETSFTNTTENADNYFWDFGDGSGSNDLTPDDHLFENFDVADDTTYNIWLVSRSQYNCYDSIRHDLTVYAKPYAEFTFPPADCPPFDADMNNESEGFDLSYYWLFDNSDVSILEEPNYTFSNGTSNVRNIPIVLIATSGMGCTDTSSRELSVYPDVIVNFSMSDTEGCSPLTVNFNGSAPNVNSMIWYIDGQPFSTLEDATYLFSNNSPNTRTYEVTFSGQSLYGCQDDTTMSVSVYSSPSAEFISDPLIQDYNTVDDQTTVNFSNQTYFQNNWQYFWDFGDGSTGNSNSLTFDHIYGYEFWGEAATNFMIPVSLVAWNNEMEECRDTVIREIFIRPPLPQIALEEDISGCEPLTVSFAATTRYVYEGQYLWDFGIDGATSTEEAPSYTYNDNGTYTVKLIVQGDGGINWDYRIVTVNPKPEIDFTFNDSIVFVRSQNQPDEIISFYNHTRYGQDYYWFFEETIEDGALPHVDMGNAQSTEAEPTWYYENAGVYNVVLLAASGEGCLDTMVSPIAIHVLGEGEIQFPTGFFVDPSAPRDENINDPNDPSRNIFRGYGQGVAEFHLEVYNRWGVLVFKSDNINKGWNGFLDGKPAKQDVYVWRAKGRFTTGRPFEMSGDVTLIVAPDLGQVH
jgi:PKD repeat protein